MAGDGYMMAAQFAMKFAGNVIGGNAKAAMEYKQYTQALQQQQLAWDKNSADNQAIAEANLTNTIRTGYRVGILNLQRAQAKKKAIQDGYDVSAQRQQALGAATANAAAAGTIGSSIAAVTSDIEQKVGEATNRIAGNYEQTEDNFDTALQDTLWNGEDTLRSPEKLYMTDLVKPAGFSYWGAAFDAGMEMGESYMNSKMSLGLGSKSGGTSSGGGGS
jgi:hypothetical protein